MQASELDVSFFLNRTEIGISSAIVEEVVSGQTILITGSGGSVGGALFSEIVKHDFKKLVLLDRSETGHIRTYKNTGGDIAGKTFQELCDVANPSRLNNIFKKYKPDIVFHTAAYKHVPILELYPIEAALNNTLATKLVADLCDRYNVKKSVFISTDKAVYPETMLGASKRLGEFYYHAIDRKNANTEKSQLVVRFGNVLGSSGSVVQIFKEQIANGGPVTITDKNAERFFMTSKEAVNLIISAVHEATHRKQRGVSYVLDLGPAVRIEDIATKLIMKAGAQSENIPIEYMGLRPGERLRERLYEDDEVISDCNNKYIKAARFQPYTFVEIQDILNTIQSMTEHCQEKELRNYLIETTNTKNLSDRLQKEMA